jgi:hypothetical protein
MTEEKHLRMSAAKRKRKETERAALLENFKSKSSGADKRTKYPKLKKQYGVLLEHGRCDEKGVVHFPAEHIVDGPCTWVAFTPSGDKFLAVITYRSMKSLSARDQLIRQKKNKALRLWDKEQSITRVDKRGRKIVSTEKIPANVAWPFEGRPSLEYMVMESLHMVAKAIAEAITKQDNQRLMAAKEEFEILQQYVSEWMTHAIAEGDELMIDRLNAAADAVNAVARNCPELEFNTSRREITIGGFISFCTRNQRPPTRHELFIKASELSKKLKGDPLKTMNQSQFVRDLLPVCGLLWLR